MFITEPSVGGFAWEYRIPLPPMNNRKTTTKRAIKLLVHETDSGIQHLKFPKHTIGYIRQGSLCLCEEERRVISKGEIYILRAGWHSVEYFPEHSKPCEELTIQLSNSPLNFLLGYVEQSRLDSFCADHTPLATFAHHKATPSLAIYYNGLHKYLLNKTLDKDRAMEHLKIGELIYLLLSLPSSSIATQLCQMTALHSTDFQEYVRANTFNRLTIAQLADGCGMCPSTFKMTFSRHFGTSPHTWIMEQRMSAICSALQYTNHPIKNLAHECGFASPSHMIRIFKRKYGVTPSQYRATHTKLQRFDTQSD